MKSWPCKTCGKKVTSVKVHGRLEADPYCSATCCRKDHDLSTFSVSVSTDFSRTGKTRDPMLSA